MVGKPLILHARFKEVDEGEKQVSEREQAFASFEKGQNRLAEQVRQLQERLQAEEHQMDLAAEAARLAALERCHSDVQPRHHALLVRRASYFPLRLEPLAQRQNLF